MTPVFMSVLPHTVTIEKATFADDSSGGNTVSWATRTASVACLISQQSGDGVNGQTHTVSYPLQASITADARPGDRLLVGTGSGFSAGLYLAVTGITQHGGVGGIDPFVRLQCRQVLSSWTPDR